MDSISDLLYALFGYAGVILVLVTTYIVYRGIRTFFSIASHDDRDDDDPGPGLFKDLER